MNTIPELVPISELRQRQSEVLNQLTKHPVVLTQHGRATAVLVSPELWNQLLEELEELRETQEATQPQETNSNIQDFENYLYQQQSAFREHTFKESSDAAWDYYEYLADLLRQESPSGKTTQEVIDEIRES